MALFLIKKIEIIDKINNTILNKDKIANKCIL